LDGEHGPEYFLLRNAVALGHIAEQGGAAEISFGGYRA
jgi:hypothetical protein